MINLKNNPLIILLSILILFSSAQSLFGQLYIEDKLPPSLKWKTLHTKHFYIHFTPELEHIAFKMKEIAEEVHKKLSKRIKWKPYFKTSIILTDMTDLPNGMASIFPLNHIVIYTKRPDLDSTLNNYSDWLRTLFIHEYAHILNMDTISGIPGALRYFPGRLYHPNLFLPTWIIEGNAIVHESRNGKGRIHSAYAHMIMRKEVESNSLKDISKASHFPRKWPMGRVPYIYGAFFSDYLEKRFGKGVIDKIYYENSDNIIPFMANKSAKDIMGLPFTTLWKDWQKKLKEDYSKKIKSLKAQGITKYYQISEKYSSLILPRFGKNNTLYYFNINRKKENTLVQISLKDKKKKTITDVIYPQCISVRNNSLIISDIELYNTYKTYSDIYTINKYRKRITRGLRIKYFDQHKNHIYGINSQSDRYNLIKINLKTKKRTYLIKNSPIQIAFIRLNRQGTRAVFTFKRNKAHTDIAIIDLKRGDVTRITNDSFIDIEPLWHPDGKGIVFSSDRSGIYNLYEYNLETKLLRRLTNLTGGAFSPDISSDGKKIAFSSYEAKGRVIAVMDYPETKKGIILETEKMKKDFFLNKTEKDKNNKDSKVKDKIKSYNPLLTLWPTFLAPQYNAGELYSGFYEHYAGFMTLGMDALNHHYYEISVLFGVLTGNISIDVFYLYKQLYPDFALGYIDNALYINNYKERMPWQTNYNGAFILSTSRNAYITMMIPLYFMRIQHDFSLSYVWSMVYLDGYNATPLINNLMQAKLQFTYSLSTLKKFNWSISPEKGRSLFLRADWYSTYFLSDYSSVILRGAYREYLPSFFDNHVILLEARGGYCFGNPSILNPPFYLGRFSTGTTATPSQSLRSWGLRGYSASSMNGIALAAATLEYRLPIIQVDAGISTWPILFRDLWFILLFDTGNTYNPGESFENFKFSVGGELHMRITFSYRLDLTAYIGYARGLTAEGENQIYFGLSTFLEGAFQKRIKVLD